jgi:hypothetical protein
MKVKQKVDVGLTKETQFTRYVIALSLLPKEQTLTFSDLGQPNGKKQRQQAT